MQIPKTRGIMMKQNDQLLEDIAQRSKKVREETGICPHSDQGHLYPSKDEAKYCPFEGTVECGHAGKIVPFYGIDRYGKITVVPLNLCKHEPESEKPQAAD
jgi:hypothetical protein